MREPSLARPSGPEFRRFARFLAVGIVNTAFGYLVFAGGLFAGLAPELALLIATIAGVGFNFLTTGRLVFASCDNRLLPRFVTVYAAIYCVNALALRGIIDAGISSFYAQLLLLPLVVVCTFVAMRRFVFQEKTR